MLSCQGSQRNGFLHLKKHAWESLRPGPLEIVLRHHLCSSRPTSVWSSIARSMQRVCCETEFTCAVLSKLTRRITYRHRRQYVLHSCTESRPNKQFQFKDLGASFHSSTEQPTLPSNWTLSNFHSQWFALFREYHRYDRLKSNHKSSGEFQAFSRIPLVILCLCSNRRLLRRCPIPTESYSHLRRPHALCLRSRWCTGRLRSSQRSMFWCLDRLSCCVAWFCLLFLFLLVKGVYVVECQWRHAREELTAKTLNQFLSMKTEQGEETYASIWVASARRW